MMAKEKFYPLPTGGGNENGWKRCTRILVQERVVALYDSGKTEDEICEFFGASPSVSSSYQVRQVVRSIITREIAARERAE